MGLLRRLVCKLTPLGETLGRGTSGSVTQHMATLEGDPCAEPTTVVVAVKQHDFSVAALVEGVTGCVLQRLATHIPPHLQPHANTIAWIHQAVFNPATYSMSTISISGAVGDVATLLPTIRGGLGFFAAPACFVSTCLSLVSAARLLAAGGISHNDIKPGNVIVTAWQPGTQLPRQVALVDFASAFFYGGPVTVLSGVPRTTRHTCSPAYPGPCKDPVATTAFALGIVMCNLLAGEEYATMGASIFAHHHHPGDEERTFTRAHALLKLATCMALGGTQADTPDKVAAQVLTTFPDLACKYTLATWAARATGHPATATKITAFLAAVLQVVVALVDMNTQFAAATGHAPPCTLLDDVVAMPLFTDPTLCEFSVCTPDPTPLACACACACACVG